MPKKDFLILVGIFILLFVGCDFSYKPEPTPAPTEIVVTPEPTIQVFEIKIIATPTPVPIPASTPEPTPVPDPALLPYYEFDKGEARCLARAMWSLTGKYVSDETKIALCEVIQNRVDYAGETFPDTIRYVLLQGRGTDHPEFGGYDPKAEVSEKNSELAAYVMRTWMHAREGDRSYRLVPPEGVRCKIYKIDGRDYIKVYDIDWNLVYDNGRDKKNGN